MVMVPEKKATLGILNVPFTVNVPPVRANTLMAEFPFNVPVPLIVMEPVE